MQVGQLRRRRGPGVGRGKGSWQPGADVLTRSSSSMVAVDITAITCRANDWAISAMRCSSVSISLAMLGRPSLSATGCRPLLDACLRDEVAHRREVVGPEEAHLVRIRRLAEADRVGVEVVVVALPAQALVRREREEVRV